MKIYGFLYEVKGNSCLCKFVLLYIGRSLVPYLNKDSIPL